MMKKIIAILLAMCMILSMTACDLIESLTPEDTSPTSDKSVFKNNTWAEIAAACQSGNVPDTWEVGDMKKMVIDDVTYDVAIIGKNHDIYADGSGIAPLTFQVMRPVMQESMEDVESNFNGWVNSKLRALLNSDEFIGKLPEDVGANLKAVVKKTNARQDQWEWCPSTMVESYDKIFLLARVEVCGNDFLDWYANVYMPWKLNRTFNGTAEQMETVLQEYAESLGFESAEGHQYAFYAQIKKIETEPTAEYISVSHDWSYWYDMSLASIGMTWWLRTPEFDTQNKFYNIDCNGDIYITSIVTERSGVSFAFCF